MQLLETNFREIYHAVKFPSKLLFPLVADRSALRIYDSRYAFGYLWRVFYKISNRNTIVYSPQDQLHKAILHTHRLFHQEIAQMQNSLNAYLNYIKKSGEGYCPAESDFFQARHLITRWNTATHPFLKILQNPSFKNRFNEIFKTIPIELSFDSPCNSNLRLCQKIIDLEGYVKGPLPLQTFKKIIREIPLNPLDQKELDQWIFKTAHYKIEMKPVHEALSAITHLFAKKNCSPECKNELLSKLELFLENQGCGTFQKNDPKHIKWRQTLSEGTKILFDDSEVILERPLFSNLSGSGRMQAYTIRGRPDLITLVAHNPLALRLRNLKLNTHNPLDIKSAFLKKISKDGKVALAKRLYLLNAIKWTSPFKNSLIETIAKLVNTLITLNLTPINFFSSCIMYNEQGQLKLVKPITMGAFDFNAIEDFIFECSAGNAQIYREMMVKSGMSAHPAAKYYRDIVANVLNKENIAPDDLAGIYQISDPKIVDRATSLMKKIESAKKKLLFQLRLSFPKMNPEQLKKQANEILLKKYIQSNAAGILWNDLTYSVA